MQKLSKGFTLVEMSIVMVIIGLLIAGTLTGKALMESSAIRSLVAKVNEYKGAIRQFELDYDGLPGDIKDASSYFSGVADGDGNEKVDSETSNEPFEAVRQLVSAEMITVKGTLTGLWGTGFVAASSGVSGNVPYAVKDFLIYIRCCSTTDYARSLAFNNHIAVFAINSNDDYRDGILTPLEAYEIDTKIDDGLPDYGFVGASAGYAGGYSTTTPCYTGTGATSVYQNANATYKDATGCQMQFSYDNN
jgi:prepilin-type N-terminal cleavage/methylation domain-containing protein